MTSNKTLINWTVPLSLALTLPTVYFIFISIMKYSFGIPLFYDSISPLMESMGLKESLGWNINLLILFGPILALIILFFSILKVGWNVSSESFVLQLTIKRNLFALLVWALSLASLIILFFYLLAENIF